MDETGIKLMIYFMSIDWIKEWQEATHTDKQILCFLLQIKFRGKGIPNWNLACFVLYLKIIIFFGGG